jgi:hypothetical protein
MTAVPMTFDNRSVDRVAMVSIVASAYALAEETKHHTAELVAWRRVGERDAGALVIAAEDLKNLLKCSATDERLIAQAERVAAASDKCRQHLALDSRGLMHKLRARMKEVHGPDYDLPEFTGEEDEHPNARRAL